MSSGDKWNLVPEALRLTGRWSTWRYHDRDGRRAKVPSARVNDPRTWISFEDAVARASVPSVRAHGGIGFLLGDGWCGVDIDGAYTDNSSRILVSSEVYGILREVGGYQEISPSGTGIKCIGRGDRIGLELNFKHNVLDPVVTLWTGPRFFTVTGEEIATSGDPLLDLNLSQWPGKVNSPRTVGERPPWVTVGDTRGTEGLLPVKTGADYSDDVLLHIAHKHPKFLGLFWGSTVDYGGDHSRADAALCAMLAFYTGRDPERIDRLFRMSGLMRDKWNTSSYRHATIRKAVALSDSIWERSEF